eukprot:CAMPEP_0173059310 /NCGR_PEP_ID=MMETSP1102-20130122/1892_1 /TAXON_ID=49646 /ORGANISM="Geminigera sp., Strain Caron Lab Isolate" /LENGTH=200 /DNA_ID=CAMNT_0013925257 /DNA_START=532 /DNA_END=1135 /DNA_ORIENTATION=-
MQCHFTCLYKASAAFSGCLFLCSFVPFKVEALKSQRLPPNISKEMIAAEGIGQRPFSAPKNGLPPWLPVLSFALAFDKMGTAVRTEKRGERRGKEHPYLHTFNRSPCHRLHSSSAMASHNSAGMSDRVLRRIEENVEFEAHGGARISVITSDTPSPPCSKTAPCKRASCTACAGLFMAMSARRRAARSHGTGDPTDGGQA